MASRAGWHHHRDTALREALTGGASRESLAAALGVRAEEIPSMLQVSQVDQARDAESA